MSDRWNTTILSGYKWEKTLTYSVDGVPVASWSGYTAFCRIGSISLAVGTGITFGSSGHVTLALSQVQVATLIDEESYAITLDIIQPSGVPLPRLNGTAAVE